MTVSQSNQMQMVRHEAIDRGKIVFFGDFLQKRDKYMNDRGPGKNLLPLSNADRKCCG